MPSDFLVLLAVFILPAIICGDGELTNWLTIWSIVEGRLLSEPPDEHRAIEACHFVYSLSEKSFNSFMSSGLMDLLFSICAIVMLTITRALVACLSRFLIRSAMVNSTAF
jgi:hypothetical protein